MKIILINHAKRHPGWQISDLYKLIHQAALGPGHLLVDESEARERLRSELAYLGHGLGEALIDPISPDGRIARIHLRPFVQLQLDPELLLQAFQCSARQVPPTPERLEEYIDFAVRMVGEGLLPFREGEVSGYFNEMRSAGFPAVHHSREYAQLYRPAYRVVAQDLLAAEILAAGLDP